MGETRRGILLGLAAWIMWGFFPLYWPLLEPAGAVEILAHRIVWSLIVMAAVVVALRRGSALRATLADRRTRSLLAVAA
ncbi:MAG: EamA family transporter RarD, partial [Nocardioidaceae bacterium]